jgi:cytochrome c biogenesis protein CcmG, thiol:disulfide interchange protein DsbE
MKINLLCLLILLYAGVNAQEKESSNRALPAVDVKTSDGSVFNTSKFSNEGKPVIIDFWATWCKPCIEELNTIHEVYGDWQKETGVKMVIISLDDARTMTRVGPFVNSHNWAYESYLDPNGDFKRAMNVNMPPHTFVLNGKGEIVWQHVGFAEGNEQELYDVVKKIAEGKSLEK